MPTRSCRTSRRSPRRRNRPHVAAPTPAGPRGDQHSRRRPTSESVTESRRFFRRAPTSPPQQDNSTGNQNVPERGLIDTPSTGTPGAGGCGFEPTGVPGVLPCDNSAEPPPLRRRSGRCRLREMSGARIVHRCGRDDEGLSRARFRDHYRPSACMANSRTRPTGKSSTSGK